MSKKESDEMDSDELGGYVPIVYARSFEQGDWYCQLLADHDIPAIMDEDYEPPVGKSDRHHRGVPVLVPESMLPDARECISQLDEMEGFGEDDADEAEEDDFSPAGGFETGQSDDEENEYF